MLERKFYQIRDALMKVRINLLEGTANEFDFYRYLPKREKELSEKVRNQIKRKFQAVFKLFLYRVRTNSSKEIETLNEIQDMLTLRKFKQYELNDFKIDADITSDDQDLIKNTLIPIADIIKTRKENFESFQRQNPKLFIDYYRKKAMKSGALMNQKVIPGNDFMLNPSQLDTRNAQSRGKAKGIGKAVDDVNDMQDEWEDNIEKVTNLLEYQNAKITSIIDDFKTEQDDIEEELKRVLDKIND
jgi:hypothetical protein